MIIRKAQPSDADTVLKYDRHISPKELQNSINLGRVYIVQSDETFVGWLRYNMFWDNTPFMNMLYILDNFRHCGAGTKLTQTWENEMKALGFNLVMTSTVKEETAKYFYKKLGYCTVGSFTLPGDSEEIIMCKKI